MATDKGITIYHNPRCGKSRNALKMLQEAEVEPTIVEYLLHPPDKSELKSLLKKLGMKPHDLIRTKETVYIEHYKGKSLTDEEWLDVLAKHPILIERPVVIIGSKAWIVRTDDALNEIKQIIK